MIKIQNDRFSKWLLPKENPHNSSLTQAKYTQPTQTPRITYIMYWTGWRKLIAHSQDLLICFNVYTLPSSLYLFSFISPFFAHLYLLPFSLLPPSLSTLPPFFLESVQLCFCYKDAVVSIHIMTWFNSRLPFSPPPPLPPPSYSILPWYWVWCRQIKTVCISVSQCFQTLPFPSSQKIPLLFFASAATIFSLIHFVEFWRNHQGRLISVPPFPPDIIWCDKTHAYHRKLYVSTSRHDNMNKSITFNEILLLIITSITSQRLTL